MKGFNYPLTPKGKSTLNPRPPWYYSADFLNIEFWAEPSAVAALLPHSVKIEQAWRGEGSLTLPVCRGEEISDLAPVGCGKGIRASMAYVVDDLRTLKDLRK